MNVLRHSLAVAIVGILTLGRAGAADLWQAYSYIPSPASPEIVRLEQTAKAITEGTKGQIRVRAAPGGALPIKAEDTAQAVADDVIQYAQLTGVLVGFMPIYGVSRVPGLYATREEYQKAADILTPYYRRLLAAKGVQFLGQFYYPEQTIFARSDSFKELADLKGLKVRVASPQQNIVVQSYGGVPVTIATPEVAPALQQGRVDAVLTANAGGGRIWIDLFKVNYRIVVNWSSGIIAMNKKRYDALNADQRALVDRVSAAEATNVTRDLLTQEDQLIAQFAKDKGVKFLPPKPADMKDIARFSAPVWEEEAKKAGPDGIRALAEIRKALGK